MGFEPMSNTTVALTAHYLNVRPRKLDTIITQTVQFISYSMIVRTLAMSWHAQSSLFPMEAVKYQWRRLMLNCQAQKYISRAYLRICFVQYVDL
jgi:hypothetical protein